MSGHRTLESTGEAAAVATIGFPFIRCENIYDEKHPYQDGRPGRVLYSMGTKQPNPDFDQTDPGTGATIPLPMQTVLNAYRDGMSCGEKGATPKAFTEFENALAAAGKDLAPAVINGFAALLAAAMGAYEHNRQRMARRWMDEDTQWVEFRRRGPNKREDTKDGTRVTDQSTIIKVRRNCPEWIRKRWKF